MSSLGSKIFIDGADPAETKAADELLKKAGFLTGVAGQTTNPSLIAKRFQNELRNKNYDLGKKPKEQELIEYYKQTVVEIAKMIPDGAISIQVIGEPSSLTKDEMLRQARDRITWIPNGVVKFPATTAGLEAAEVFCQEGPVNITLTFSQDQAAAVYVATKAHNYDVYVSPFVGRLDDRGERGMDVAANIIEMYKKFGDGHVKVLTASVRNVEHIKYAEYLGSDIITVPLKVLEEWQTKGFPLPTAEPGPEGEYVYDAPGLTEIPYRELTLDVDWHEFNLDHDLTTIGMQKFWDDWKAVIG